MAKDSNSGYRFFPRPEAHPMDWESLLPPVQNAVQKLLFRIEGATRDEPKEGDATANCFLVYGDRGTGKTTVLLSAQHACTEKDFFPGAGPDEKENKPVLAAARNSAGRLRNVLWLEVLDLEPLTPRTNLLTTVLTRVRNALDAPGTENKATELTSILEESAESARHKLDRLIKDATLMWEDILEVDTRGRANRQVDAADIYAQYRSHFREAMDSLSRELGRRSGGADTYRSLVLPVDNIDRSTDHLYGIVKLAQLVSCPRLWLVMAGDRQDVDTFLERAFWKELIRVGEGAGATGKTGLGGEDEALVMARRQAGAASHKLLPPIHRIAVGLVEPKDTLEFSYSPGNDKTVTIRQLLEAIDVAEKLRPEIKLIDLFDATQRVGRVTGKTDKRCLTDAAQLGLRLPARGVLDLWQIAYEILHDDTVQGAHKAEHIARTMLRNAVTESMMSSDTGRWLQEQIVRRTPRGGTILDLQDPTTQQPSSTLEVLRLWQPEFRLYIGRIPLQKESSEQKALDSERKENSRGRGVESEQWVESTLQVANTKAMMLRLTYFPQRDRDVPSKDILPDLVAAWMTILYDVLVLGAKDSTVISRARMRAPAVVGHSYWFSSPEKPPQEVEWPMPDWESFIGYDLNGQFWRHFLATLDCRFTDESLVDLAAKDGVLPRLLAAGWVACVLETFLVLPPPGNWKDAGAILKPLTESLCVEQGEPDWMKNAVAKAEQLVVTSVAQISKQIAGVIPRVFRFEEGTWPMGVWLKRDWLFLQQELRVLEELSRRPTPDTDATAGAQEIPAP